jgi:hypothetical protein
VDVPVQTVGGDEDEAEAFFGFGDLGKSPKFAAQHLRLLFGQGDFAVVEFYFEDVDDVGSSPRRAFSPVHIAIIFAKHTRYPTDNRSLPFFQRIKTGANAHRHMHLFLILNSLLFLS